MSTKYKTTGKRVGLDPNTPAAQIDKIAAFSNIDNLDIKFVDQYKRQIKSFWSIERLYSLYR